MKRRRCTTSEISLLSDDVVMEILTRIRVHDVLNCRKVCRRWRDLTSTQHFQGMYTEAKVFRPSSILVHTKFPRIRTEEFFLLDKWQQSRKRSVIRRPHSSLIDNLESPLIRPPISSGGLIVMESYDYTNGMLAFTVFNPISRDEVKVGIAGLKSVEDINVYGMFFNRSIKAHCIIFGTLERVDHEPDVEFQMLILGANPFQKTLKRPSSFVNKRICPRHCEPPVVIDDDTLYWWVELCRGHPASCEELIMSFDIKKEKFTLMPHPHIDDCQALNHINMHIVKTDGLLSFVQCRVTPELTSVIINVWTLKDSAASVWVKIHNVSIDIHQFNIPRQRMYSGFKVMAVENGELLLRYFHERIYAYNLESGALRTIGKTYRNSNISIHVPSIVSLRNGKSVEVHGS